MNEDKKYHVQLAIFEVTKEGDDDETWDWVQEIDLCNPVDSLEETMLPLELMHTAFEELVHIFQKYSQQDDVRDQEALETYMQLEASMRTAIEETFDR